MNYCYDIFINMNEDKPLFFYEWENFDPIELIKKIPLFRVNTKTLKDFYLYDIEVNKELLDSLLDKTIIKNNKLNKTIKYACLLCDSKNTLVVEFNSDGKIFSRSNLLLEDEAQIIEFIYSYNEVKIDYKRGDLLNSQNILRQEELVKKIIMIELKTILENNNDSKLKYLFNEWFGYEENDLTKMKDKIMDELNKGISNKTNKIYNLIVMSYNKN